MSECAAIYEEVHPPTAVFHSVTAWLTKPHSKDDFPELVVSKGTVLEVYALLQVDGERKLALLDSLALAGFTESLACLPYRHTGQGRDSIVLTFRDAKAAVLSWDPGSRTLVTTSLHCFETDPQLRHCQTVFEREPLALADPQGRCAAVMVYDSCLGVMPAVIPDVLELAVAGESGAALASDCASVGNSYVDDLHVSTNISQVRDATFLQGYTEPVLLVLHEPTPSWAGARSSAKDTCALSALSLSLGRRTQAQIWRVEGLPSDAQRVRPAPLGGAVVLAQGGVLFVDQGTVTAVVTSAACAPRPAPPPLVSEYGTDELPGRTAARYAAEHTQATSEVLPAMLLKCPRAPNVDVECETAALGWISNDAAVVSVKSGQLLLLRLVRGAGSVTALKASRGRWREVSLTGVAPPASSVCVLDAAGSLLFLGSVLGDSLLVQAAASQAARAQDKDLSAGGDAEDRMQEDAASAPQAPQVADAEDSEALQLYGVALSGSGTGAGEEAQAGARLAMSVLDSLTNIGPIRDLSLYKDPNEELPHLVGCSGQAKTGALCILRQSVVPSVITHVPLPGVTGLWSVCLEKEEPGEGPAFDDYLVMSFAGSTKLLATGEELQEATDVVEFAADTPTLAAGAAAKGRLLIQVFAQGVRTLRGIEHLADYWVAELAPGTAPQPTVTGAHLTDDFVLILLSSGDVVLLRVDPETLQLVAVPGPASAPPGTAQLPVEAACLSEGPWTPAAWGAGHAGRCSVLCRKGGVLELFSTDSWTLLGQATLDIACPVTELRLDSFGAVASARPDQKAPAVSAVPLAADPFLVALLQDGSVQAYRPFWDGTSLRLKPLPLGLDANGPVGEATGAQPSRLRRFEGLGEDVPCSGVAISGARPCMLIAARQTLVAHPLALGPAREGQPVGVAAFTPFHNVNCPYGFITSTGGERGGLQIGQLPSQTRLDCPWPRQKLPLRATPLRVAPYPEAGLLALLLEKQGVPGELLPEEDGSEPHAAYAYALTGAVPASATTRHEVCLMRPGAWSPLWRHALEVGEHGLALRTVRLRAGDGATLPFLAVGAGFVAGEDYPCLGRVLLCQIKRGPGGDWAPRVVAARDFKGPITQIDVIGGALLVATGNRLELCALTQTGEQDFALQRTAFYDGPMLINSLHVIKNFILIGDALHGLEFVSYSPETRQFSQLSRDVGRSSSVAAALLITGRQLQMLCSTPDGTLRVFAYDPADPESWKGHHLLHKASFHVGEPVCSVLGVDLAKLAGRGPPAFLGALLGFPSGAVGLVRGSPAPLELAGPLEAALRALALAAPAPAGLNARAWRLRGSCGRERSLVLDAALSRAWAQLAQSRRAALDGANAPSLLRAVRSVPLL